jgi:hypothetical protein
MEFTLRSLECLFFSVRVSQEKLFKVIVLAGALLGGQCLAEFHCVEQIISCANIEVKFNWILNTAEEH